MLPDLWAIFLELQISYPRAQKAKTFKVCRLPWGDMLWRPRPFLQGVCSVHVEKDLSLALPSPTPSSLLEVLIRVKEDRRWRGIMR